MKNFTNFSNDSDEVTIVLRPSAGAEITACCEEAICIAVHNSCRVNFTHNGRAIVVDPKLIVRPLWEQWNAQSFGGADGLAGAKEGE